MFEAHQCYRVLGHIEEMSQVRRDVLLHYVAVIPFPYHVAVLRICR